MTKHSADEYRDAVRTCAIALRNDIDHTIHPRCDLEPLDWIVDIGSWRAQMETLALLVDTWQDRLDFEREADRQAREAEQEETVF